MAIESDGSSEAMMAPTLASNRDTLTRYLDNNGAMYVIIVTALAVSGALLCLDIIHLVDFSVNSTSSNILGTILLLSSLIALIYMLKSKGDDVFDLANRIQLTILKFYPLGVRSIRVVVCLFGLLSLITTVFGTIAAANCFASTVNLSEIVKFFVNIVKSTFIVCQMICVVSMNIYKGKSRQTAVCTLVIILTNICLCAHCLLEAIEQTLLNTKYNVTDIEPYKIPFCKYQSDAMRKAYRTLDKYFYTFIVPFCLACTELFCVVWTSVSQVERSIQADGQEDAINNGKNEKEIRVGISGSAERRPLLGRQCPEKSTASWLKSMLCINLCGYSFLPTTVLCIILIVLQTILDAKMQNANTTDDTVLKMDILFVVMLTVYENVMSGAAFVGILMIRKEASNKLNPKLILLLLTAVVFFIGVLLEIIDASLNINHHINFQNTFFTIRSLFHVLGLIFQTLFLIKASNLPDVLCNTYRRPCIQGILWFLAICNLERYIVDTFLTPTVLRHFSSVTYDNFGQTSWIVITRISYPIVAMYRLQSSFLCFESLKKLKAQCEHQKDDTVSDQ